METVKFDCDGCNRFVAKSEGIFSTDSKLLAMAKTGIAVKFLFFHCNDCLKVGK